MSSFLPFKKLLQTQEKGQRKEGEVARVRVGCGGELQVREHAPVCEKVAVSAG